MATMRLSTAAGNAVLSALLAQFDAGSGPATVKIYTGTMPATPDTALAGQTLLGTLTCSDPSGFVATKMLTFGSITQDSAADADGTATWARIADSTGAAVIDVDVTSSAGSGTIKLNTVAIRAGGPIQLSSFVISV